MFGKPKCPNCGEKYDAKAQFCGSCGQPTPKNPEHNALEDNRWARPADQVAWRANARVLGSLKADRLIVDEGSQALFYQNGKYVGTLEPGRHSMKTLIERNFPTFKSIFSPKLPSMAVLVDTGDFETLFSFEELRSHDRMRALIDGSLILKVHDGHKLAERLLHGQQSLSRQDIREQLEDALQSVCSEFTSARAAEDLHERGLVASEVEREMRMKLAPTLERWGLELVRINRAQVAIPDWQAQVESENDLTIKEHRLKVEAAIRELDAQEGKHKFQTQHELDEFVRQIDHERGLKEWLRSEESAKARNAFDENELNRKQTIERLKMEMHFELQRLDARARGDLKEEEFERASKLRRMELEQRLSDQRIEWTQDREIKLTEERDALQAKLEASRAEGEMQAIQLELKKKEMEIVEAHQEREAERRSKERRDQMELYLQARAAKHRETMQTDEQKAHLAMEELRAKRDMTPEQMLAFAAEKNPVAAEALKAKFTAEGSSQAEQVSMLKDLLDKQDSQRNADLDRFERFSRDMAGQIGATAQAFAGHGPGYVQPPQPRPYAPQPGSPTAQPVAPQKIVMCSACNHENIYGTKFCVNCGQKIGN